MVDTPMHRLLDLAMTVSSHQALNNDFYDAWSNRRMSGEELSLFALNYGAWVRSFPTTLSMLFTASTDLREQIEHVRTLLSEMGNGEAERVHWVLLNSFFTDLGRAMKTRIPLDWPSLSTRGPMLHSTTALIEGERELYTSENRAIAAGAQLALEWQAYSMLRKLYEGARNYAALWSDEDAFHESCEYFHAHLGATEKEHKRGALAAACAHQINESSFLDTQAGFELHLSLIAGFWSGLAQALVSASVECSALSESDEDTSKRN